jgi:hypothetical protein
VNYEHLIMLWAAGLEHRGDWVAANWARSQVQELAIELARTQDGIGLP